jgi:hypothetical protein
MNKSTEVESRLVMGRERWCVCVCVVLLGIKLKNLRISGRRSTTELPPVTPLRLLENEG